MTGVGHFQPGFSSLESKVVCEQDRLGSQHALVKDAGLVSPSSRAQKPLFAPVIGDCSTPRDSALLDRKVVRHVSGLDRDSPVMSRHEVSKDRAVHAYSRENVGVCVLTHRDSEPVRAEVKGPVPTMASSEGVSARPLSILSSDGSHPQRTVSTQTATVAKPFLSIQAIPLTAIYPVRSRLGRSKTVTTDFFPVEKCDKGVSFSPSSCDKGLEVRPLVANQDTFCSPLVSDQGTSPSIPISFSPEPPAKAVTQGPSFPYTSGLSGLPSGSSAQASSSSSFPASPRTRDEGDDDSGSESEAESVVLADPTDPSTELLSASESFSLLKKKIVDKYIEIKQESKVVERSSFQSAFEREKPKSAPLKMTQAVKSRLAAIDEELVIKKASSSSVTVFSPYLKNRDFKYYLTEIKPEFEA